MLVPHDSACYDAAMHRGLVYTVRADAVVVYKLDTDDWKESQRFMTPCADSLLTKDDKDRHRHTLAITNTRILVCCYVNHRIYEFSHLGELTDTRGRSCDECRDSDVTRDDRYGHFVYPAGVLCNPVICHADAEGTVLVADRGNHRLQVLTSDGAWKIVQISHELNLPQAALCFDRRFVVDSKDEKLIIFS